MTNDKIREVLDRYEQVLADRQGDVYRHLQSMIPKMQDMLATSVRLWEAQVPDVPDQPVTRIAAWSLHREKLMRWLGFMQGALWLKGIYTIDEMRAHNMPDGE